GSRARTSPLGCCRQPPVTKPAGTPSGSPAEHRRKMSNSRPAKMTETNKLTTWILWILAAAYAAALVANISLGLGIPIAVVLLISVAFALIHGAVRYVWTGIVAFVVISLVVSNILENTSILTGFPFGHYHYTDALGPKLFLVPLLIGPAYFASGYFAWVIGNVLVGELRRGSSGLLTLQFRSLPPLSWSCGT